MNNIFRKNNEPDIINFLHAKASREGVPLSGTFELTRKCCFNCKMCYVHDENCAAANELTSEQWLSVARAARENGMLLLLLTGGEPLLRSDFICLYEEFAKMGFIISINTNGYLLSGKIAETLKKFPPSRLNISLYGADRESYLELCGGDYFDRVIENIKDMKSSGINIKLNCTVTPQNCNELKEISTLANELELNIKTVTYLYPPVRKGESFAGENAGRLNPRDAAYYRLLWDEIHYDDFGERLKSIVNSTEENSDIRNKEHCSRCRAGSTCFWIDSEGNMSSCGMLNGTENVLKKDFRECWNNVKRFTREVRLPKECLGCKYKNFCNVCMAVCYTESGKTSGLPEYVCQYSKNLYDLASEKMKGDA